MPFEIPENWVWTTIEDIAESNIGLTYKPTDICGNGVPVYRSNNIQNRRICLKELVRVNTNILEKQYLQEGDLLICARNGSRNLVGKCAIIDNLNEPTSFGAFMAVCRSALNPWIFQILNSEYFNTYLDDSNSTAINQVTQKMLLTFQLPIPPAAEQERIISKLKQWYEYIDEIEDRKIELESYIKQTKSKILDLAISGKLVSQDPNDEPAIELLKQINPGFKPCDNSHYENLPENWCLAKVKDVFVINPRNKAEDNTIAGFIPMTLIDDGYSNTFSYEKREWGSIKTGFTHFADGDVAVAKISPCLENRKSIVLRDLPNGIGAGTTELHVFRSSVVVPEYALYFFKSEYFISKCVGTFNGVVGQQRVGKNIIEEIQIPIPPINEQTKIVSTIETIFTQLNTITAEL